MSVEAIVKVYGRYLVLFVISIAVCVQFLKS